MSRNRQDVYIDSQAITDKLNQLSNLLGDDLSVVMRKIAGRLERDVQEAFIHEHNPTTHEKWAELKFATRQQRIKDDKDGKILQRDGELISTLTSDYGARFAKVGLGTDYAVSHQNGRPDKNLPARPFLPTDGFHEDTQADILQIIEDEINRALQ